MVVSVQRHIHLSPALLRRLLWVVVGLGHLPGLLDAWGKLIFGNAAAGGLDSVALVRFLGLAITLVFVALKVRDVACLRLCPGRRTVIAACLVVALLHVDLMRPASESSVIPDIAVLAATVWIVVGPARIRHRLVACFSRVHTKKIDCVRANRFVGTEWLDAARPHCWLLARSLFLLRAPPV